jgi:threonine dehydratase
MRDAVIGASPSGQDLEADDAHDPRRSMTDAPSYADVLRARDRIAGHAVRTPLLSSPVLSERLGAHVYLKPECLQRTGSFKFRGAWNALSDLGDAARQGVVACSSGNHAQGVAEAARLAGIPAVIVMPADAPQLKIERTRRSGARVVTYDREREDRDAIARRIAEAEGLAFVHPFNDARVIAGQGTVGLEIAEDCAAMRLAPDMVVVPCSGGGLAAGTALALQERFAETAVFVAEPAAFDDYGRSLATGERQRNAAMGGSICDALLAPEPGAISWEIGRERMAGGVKATDAEVLRAIGFAFDELRLAVEPGGAVALAALLAGGIEAAGRTIILVLSGGNVADDTLAAGVASYRGASEA